MPTLVASAQTNYRDTADSLNLFVWRQYGYSCYLLGEYDNALKSYLKLNEHGWKNYEVNLILGICYGEADNQEKACEYLLVANKLKKERDFTVLKLLADNYLKLCMIDDGTAYLQKAINVALPDSSCIFRLYNKMGEAYFEISDYPKACSAFCNASRMNPDHALTYYNIAQMYNGMKDKENLLKYYQLFLEHSGNLPQNEENIKLIEKVKAVIDKSRK